MTDRAAQRVRAKTPLELRKFGFTMTVAFALLSTLLWYRSRAAAPYLAILAAGFLFAALIRPVVLRPVESAWMKLAELMSAVMTRVILTLTFFLVITPLGLLLRLLRKDSLNLRPAPGAETFWLPVEPDGPATRPDKPF